MIKKRFALMILIPVLAALMSTMVFPETLEEVLAKNYETRGGLKKLEAIQSMTAAGKMIAGAQSMEVPIKLWYQKPNSMKMEFDYMGQKMTMAYDGKQAWAIIPMSGNTDPQELTDERSKDFIQQADMMFPLVEYKEKGHQLEYVDKEDMEGTEVYKLKLTKKDGTILLFYLDTESGIDIKTAASIKTGETETRVETLMGDYKMVDGIMIPFSIESSSPGMGTTMKMVFETVTLNEKIEESFFRMPPKKESKEEPVKEKK